jgi:hypothetical protein
MKEIGAWLRETALLLAYSSTRAGWAISYSLATFLPGQTYAELAIAAGLAIATAGASLGVRLNGEAIRQAAESLRAEIAGCTATSTGEEAVLNSLAASIGAAS